MSTSPTRVARPAQARATDDVERYLRALFSRESPGAFIEVRYRHRDDMRRHFFQHTDTFAAARTIARLGLGTDVYVGVAARASKHAGGKDAIRRVWTLWADLDDADAHARLDELPVAPAILIASGTIGHLHAYWPLARPVSIAAAETANRRLAAQLHADTGAVTNAATILRPPGTYSFKTDPPTPVALERLDDERLDDLVCRQHARQDDPGARPSGCRRAHPRMRPMMMPPTICRTRIATIGLTSTGPIGGMKRRKRLR